MTETRDVQRESPAAKANVEDQLTSTGGPTCDSTASQPSSQLQSSFFSALPLEIRQSIYRHLWLATGSTQHVYQSGASLLAPLSHCRCIADLDAEDTREVELARILNTPPGDPATVEAGVGPGSTEERDAIMEWRYRVVSTWCNHWPCEEEPPVLRAVDTDALEDGSEEKETMPLKNRESQHRLLVKEFSPFLATLLTCRRMHGEAVDSIYDATTFSFVGTDALSRFLNTTAPDSLARITKLHLTWRAPIATYMNLDSEESLTEMARWEKMWAEVALKIPRLKELRIWAYPCYARYPMPHEEWLRALHQFGNVPKFDVSFRWFQNPPTPDTGPLDFLDDAPFEYDRIPPVQDNPLHFHWRRLIGLPPDEPRHPVSRRQKKRRYLGRAL
ncbi:hypothetical protein QIS74_09080 [Colletotrichum tabaci]|uniref:DUF7730 domain-containing protein n=1 Tax=Colletotrichum tabaci TaxID=1209068 RepID=A0AAV9T370_9PEZI